MAKKQAKGIQLITLPKSPRDLSQISFNLSKQDQFVQSHGVTFEHYTAIPSPIGLKDIGEYRRSEALDTIQENGMVYKKYGEFTAVLMGNSARHIDVEGGVEDTSTSRITLPRFYDKRTENDKDKEIHLAIGDRVYIKDLEVEVVSYQRNEFRPEYKEDLLQYPAIRVESLMDSLGREYTQDVDFSISTRGNIVWNKGKSPGVDPDTGKGRIYSVRYVYNAHWYVVQLLNEIRIGNVTDGGIRKPSRMPYHAMIQREYVYHNKRNPDDIEGNKKTITDRTAEAPDQPITNKYDVMVNVSKFKIDE